MGVMATADVCSGGYDPARAVPTVPAWPRADGSFSGRSFWEELREATAAESSTGGDRGASWRSKIRRRRSGRPAVGGARERGGRERQSGKAGGGGERAKLSILDWLSTENKPKKKGTETERKGRGR